MTFLKDHMNNPLPTMNEVAVESGTFGRGERKEKNEREHRHRHLMATTVVGTTARNQLLL